MSRACSVCTLPPEMHPKRSEQERLRVSGRGSIRAAAAALGVGVATIF